MPQLAVLHSGRAVALVGQGVIASVTNTGHEDVYVGLGDVSPDNFQHKLGPGDNAVLKGPLFASAAGSCPVTIQDDPDALRAAAEAAKPKPKPKQETPDPKPASKKKRNA